MNNEEVLFCPKCGRNFSDDTRWCQHCGVNLVSEETIEDTKQLFEQNTVVVHIAENALEAELLREVLEENGILCALVGEVPSTLLPFTVDGLAKVRILVLEDVADEARAIIKETLSQAEEDTEELFIEEEEENNEDSNSK